MFGRRRWISRLYLRESDIDNEDLCTVAGNLLDNAIEENRKCRDGGRRRIFICISSGEDFLAVTVRNPLFHELKVKNGLPVSEKPDAEHHGMGLKNVRKICDKYGGRFSGMFRRMWHEQAKWYE